jgi:hypothetical protein
MQVQMHPGVIENALGYTSQIHEVESLRSRQLLSYNQTAWALVRKRTISTDRPPLVDEM